MLPAIPLFIFLKFGVRQTTVVEFIYDAGVPVSPPNRHCIMEGEYAKLIPVTTTLVPPDIGPKEGDT